MPSELFNGEQEDMEQEAIEQLQEFENPVEEENKASKYKTAYIGFQQKSKDVV